MWGSTWETKWWCRDPANQDSRNRHSANPRSGKRDPGNWLLGEPALGVSGPGDADEGALDLGDVTGECGAALWMSGAQPVSTTMVEDTAIAGQIPFGFTTSLLCLSVT